MTNANVMT